MFEVFLFFLPYFQPKYIHNILKHAEKRKLEGERRKERQVQKEREMEGEEFADKESFVTASYLKKMEELKQAEEKARLEELQEGVCVWLSFYIIRKQILTIS